MDKMLMELDVGDLPEKYREIAEVIGIDNLIKLSRVFGGSHFYVPKEDAIIKEKVHKTIFMEFDGTNKRQLASKYHVSESTVYNIVKNLIDGNAKKKEQAAGNMEKEGKKKEQAAGNTKKKGKKRGGVMEYGGRCALWILTFENFREKNRKLLFSIKWTEN